MAKLIAYKIVCLIQIAGLCMSHLLVFLALLKAFITMHWRDEAEFAADLIGVIYSDAAPRI